MFSGGGDRDRWEDKKRMEAALNGDIETMEEFRRSDTLAA
jgi:hypothetical protein